MSSPLASALSSLLLEFDFRDAALTSPALLAGVLTVYLLTIYALQAYTQRHGAFNVTRAFSRHNLFMSLLSLVMFLGTLSETARVIVTQQGARRLLCETQGTESVGPWYFWSYVYFLSKLYELLDTVFLAAKGKLVGWGGLNVWHHVLVVPMAWLWLRESMSLQHIGIMFNTFVHVVMYYYFYCTSCGQKPTWRKYITLIQVIQFVTSFVLLLPNLYMHFTSASGCQGEPALLFNVLFNLTLLSEFMSILRRKPTKIRVEDVWHGPEPAGSPRRVEFSPQVHTKVIERISDLSLEHDTAEAPNGSSNGSTRPVQRAKKRPS